MGWAALAGVSGLLVGLVAGWACGWLLGRSDGAGTGAQLLAAAGVFALSAVPLTLLWLVRRGVR